ALLVAPALASDDATAARETITVEGNRRVEADTVRSYFHAWPGKQLDAASLDAALKALIATGLFDKVTIDRTGDKVVVHLIEAKTFTVRHINFVGNHVFGKRQLAAVIKTSATNMLSFLIGGDVYDPDLVAEDREQLRLYYRNHGYADATVTDARAEYDPATKGFTLTFSIDEGQPYHFGDISINCNVPGMDVEKLRRLLLARKGAVFDGSALD